MRRAATEDVRALVRVAPDLAEVREAGAALDAATTAEQVVAVEPLVATARAAADVTVPADRTVAIGERVVPWDQLGSYSAVVEAAQALAVGRGTAQRSRSLNAAKADDEDRGLWADTGRGFREQGPGHDW